MKVFITLVPGLFVLVSFAFGQNPAPPAHVDPPGTASSRPPADTAPPGTSERIAPGSVIPVQLTKTVDAKKAKPGEEVDAQVTADLKNPGGVIIVPKNTKIIGKVTEAQPRNKQDKESQVAIAFDHMVRGGNNVSMPMSIQAIIAPSYLTGANSNNGNGENTQLTGSSAPPSGMSPGSRSPGMSSPQQPSNASASPGAESGTNTTSSSAHPPITGNTKGVFGMQNMTLSSNATPAQGSVVTSNKGNVKLEGGTLMLLRVNQ